MKKTISILLTFIMLLTMLPMSTFAAELNLPKLTIDSFDSMPGDNVNVSINLKNNPGIVSGQVNVAFDTGLTLIGATKGDAFPSYITFTMPKQLSTVGEINDSCNIVWGGTDINDADIKDGTVLVLTFRVSADAEIGDTYNISVTPSHVNDKNLVAVELNTVQSSITIIDYTPGDVNDDGIISMLDTVMISRYIVDGCTYDPDGYAIRLNENAANVNDDGIISMLDTVMISRYIVDGCKTDPDGYNIELKSSTKKCQHEMQATEAKAETCTKDGNIAYWHCNLCDKYFADVNGSRVITFEDTIIPAKGHTVVIDPAVPATETSTGLTEGSHCSVCEEILVPQIVIPIPAPQTANITYKLVNNDSYLASQEINNPNPSTYTLGKGLTLSNDIEVPGYTFLGWYDSFASNATQIKNISASATEDITLYAHWTPISYTIQFDSDLIPVDDDTYTINQGKVLPSPKLSGYSFVGWSDESGQIIKRIPVGISGHKTYSANWLSDRNQARTKKNVGDPIILEQDNQILFAYEVGEIRNVPVSVIHDFGKIVDGGVGLEREVSHSKTVSTSEVTNYAETVAKATTENYGITLASGWQNGYSISEEWCASHGMTKEEAEQYCTNDSDNWYVSTGKSGSSTTTTYNTTDTTDMTTGTKNASETVGTSAERSASATHKEESHEDYSFKEGLSAGGNIGPVEVKGSFEASQSFGSKESDSTTNSSKNSLNASAAVSKGETQQGGTVTHTGSNTTSTGSWNSESGRGGSHSVTNTQSTRTALTETLSERTGYGKSYINTGSETQNQGFSSQESSSVSYSTGITFSTSESETITEKISTTNTIEGYHRWVWATTAHVFLVVGYDIKTSSYFTCSYSIFDDEVKRFEDYSYDTSSYDDNQTGVISFEIPTEIKDYVSEKVAGSDGLQYSRDGKVTGYTGNDDFVIIPEYKVIDGTVIKVTGIAEGAFKNKVNLPNGEDKFIGIEFSDFITEIPNNAFEGCSELKYINFKNVTNIGGFAFAGCTGLKVVKLSDKVTSIGENAFENIDAIFAYASNKDVAKSIVESGAKAIALVVSDKCEDLKDITLSVPDGTEYFGFYGGIDSAKTFNDLIIVSNADETLIQNANFKSTKKTPIHISSPDVIFAEINVSAPNFGIIFTADQTNLSIYGESIINSAKGNALLTKDLLLEQINDELYAQLQLNGDILACGNVVQNKLISFTSGKIIIISNEEYLKHLGGMYTISFNANEGKVSETSREAFFGIETDAFPKPTRDYYTFDGWYLENGNTPVTPEMLMNNSDDITLYAHWTLNPLSGWTKASNVPSGAQIVNTKWTYTYRDWQTSSSSSMSGYTRDDSKTTYTISWGSTNWYDSQRSTSETYKYVGTRTVENGTETYQSGTIHHWRYYHRKHGSVWGSRSSMPNPDQGEHNIDITWALSYNFTGSTGIVWYQSYTCPVCGKANMWIPDGEYDEPVYSQRTVYKTQYGYQQGTKNYTYHFYKDIAKESSSDPSGQSNVSNVVKMVQYRAK